MARGTNKKKGFLQRSAQQEEPDSGGQLEEMYEKLFPKIGRDFIYKEDLLRVVQQILSIIDPTGISSSLILNDIGARKKALEYKNLLDSGKDGSKIYKDLINLDDD
jgi:hypothetical protein